MTFLLVTKVHVRWAGGRDLDRKHEHCIGRQQEIVSQFRGNY